MLIFNPLPKQFQCQEFLLHLEVDEHRGSLQVVFVRRRRPKNLRDILKEGVNLSVEEQHLIDEVTSVLTS